MLLTIGLLAALFAGVLTPEASHGRFAGPMAAGRNVKLHVLLSGSRENELDRLIASQSTPGSPAYARYLTPQQFGRYFGADSATYGRAVALLRASGFTIVELPNNRRDIVVSAPSAVVSRFFQTPIDMHFERGRSFYAARYEPRIPPQLGAIAVPGLDDYAVMHSHMRLSALRGKDALVGWTPADLAVTYDLNPLYAANLDGKAVNLANATFGAATVSDLKNFETLFALPPAYQKFGSLPIDGPLSTEGNGESTVDAQWATSVARNAKFTQVVGSDTTAKVFADVYEYIVDKLGGTTHVVTTSWGLCEQDMGRAIRELDDSYFKQAAAEGQWWFAAAGDQGTDSCHDNQTHARSVEYPASSPYVVSVGGTTVVAKMSNHRATAYQGEYAWTWCGSGYVFTGGAGGGGRSVLFAKPSYQIALTPADGRRDVPDVSLQAAPIEAGYFIYQRGLNRAIGTSFAAPQWAGLLAIVQQRKGTQGLVDPHVRLYELAASADRAKYLHDPVGGNNGVPKCARDSAVFPGYDAVKGYDLSTGIGSFVGGALVDAY